MILRELTDEQRSAEWLNARFSGIVDIKLVRKDRAAKLTFETRQAAIEAKAARDRAALEEEMRRQESLAAERLGALQAPCGSVYI